MKNLAHLAQHRAAIHPSCSPGLGQHAMEARFSEQLVTHAARSCALCVTEAQMKGPAELMNALLQEPGEFLTTLVGSGHAKLAAPFLAAFIVELQENQRRVALPISTVPEIQRVFASEVAWDVPRIDWRNVAGMVCARSGHLATSS
ncbi:hypothetical protein [Arthrobacter woluwensis]|uniref:hypothetical protein n=1 Tax=Arthrobacter woluwensis TaxID=156980 RepID=UPI0038051B04